MSNVRQETVAFKGFTFEQDLKEGQQLCTTCKGVGLVVRRYPFYIGGERMKAMVQLHRRFVGDCPDCYSGVQDICQYCGKGYRQWNQHNCDGARAEREAAYAQKQREKAEKATKLTESEARAAGIEYLFSEGHDRYYSWDELADIDPEEFENLGTVWVCTSSQIGFEASDLIDNACENLHEDARDNIDKEAVAELQAFLNGWVEKHGKHTTSYYPDYKRVVLVEPPAKEAAGGDQVV